MLLILFSCGRDRWGWVARQTCDDCRFVFYYTFKLFLTTYKCLYGLALFYLTRFCTPLSAVAGRTHLRSADQHKLFAPRSSTSLFGPRAFCSSGPLSCNALPSQLRDPAISINIFRQSLRTYLFNNYSDWLCFILHHVLCFLRFRHHTCFRDSFCLASVF